MQVVVVVRGGLLQVLTVLVGQALAELDNLPALVVMVALTQALVVVVEMLLAVVMEVQESL